MDLSLEVSDVARQCLAVRRFNPCFHGSLSGR